MCIYYVAMPSYCMSSKVKGIVFKSMLAKSFLKKFELMLFTLYLQRTINKGLCRFLWLSLTP